MHHRLSPRRPTFRRLTFRRTASTVTVLTAVPAAVVALPVVSSAAPAPHPVVPHVRTLAVPATAAAAATTPAATAHSAVAHVVADTGQRHTATFDLVGARWQRGTLGAGDRLQVRVHTDGRWSDWTDLDPADGGPDGGSKDAAAAARVAGGEQSSEPVWVGDADGVQLRALGAGGAAPRGLRAVLVDGGHSDADASVGRSTPAATAHAATGQPTIYTRAQWGADESLRTANGASCATPDYGSTIKVGFVHHTDTANGYAPGDVPGIIRSIYAYHVQSNGWCDIGYNFLVDSFGRIWEGRYGGVTRPVIGAHTGGFNTNTFGTALIGTFGSTSPSGPMWTSLEQLFAWKLGMYYRDPNGSEQLTAGSFSGSRYPAGSTVTMRTISGHRDADLTSCPGDAAYAQLPDVRGATSHYLGAGFVDPTLSATSQPYGSTAGFTVTSGVLTDTGWTLTVQDGNGAQVATSSGSAAAGGSFTATWNGNGASGVPALPGTYHLTLTGTSPAGQVLAWTSDVQVLPPIDVSGPTSAPLNTTVTLTGNAPAGASVQLMLHKRFSTGYTAAGTTTAGPDGRYSISYLADDDYRWYTTEGGFSADPGLTQIAPTLVPGPPQVSPDSPVQLSGTALPRSTVQLFLQPSGGSTFAAGATTTAGGDGSWSLGYTADRGYSYYVSSNGRTSPTATTALPAPPTLSGPTSASYGAPVVLTGKAQPNDTVALWLHERGTVGYARVGAVTAAPDGSFAVRFIAADDYRWYVTGSTGRSPDGLTQVVPTISGPATAARGAAVYLTGTVVPGDAVSLWLHKRNTVGYANVGTIPAGADGSYTVRFTAVDDYRWYVTAHGIASPTGLTQIPH